MLHRLLNALGQRQCSAEEQAYATRVLGVIESVRQCCEDWTERAASTSDYTALANLAAVRRWELARAAQELSAQAPPPGLRREAEDSARAIVLVADGFQRLTQGYRFSKFERVCDGLSLLESGWERCQRIAARLKQCATTRP